MFHKNPLRIYFGSFALALLLAGCAWFSAFGQTTDSIFPKGEGVSTGIDGTRAVTDYSFLSGAFSLGNPDRIPFMNGAGTALTTSALFLFDGSDGLKVTAATTIDTVAVFTSDDADAFISFSDDTTADDEEVQVGARGDELVFRTQGIDTMVLNASDATVDMQLIPSPGGLFEIGAFRAASAGDGSGPDLRIRGAPGVGTNQDGGDIVLIPGAETGSGTVGTFTIAGTTVIQQPIEASPPLTLRTIDSTENIEWVSESRFLETTDATVTTIWSRVVPVNTSLVVEATIIGMRDIAEGGGDVIATEIFGLFHRGTGSIDLGDSDTSRLLDFGATGYNIVIIATGTDAAEFTVQGLASQDVDWKIHVRYMEVLNP